MAADSVEYEVRDGIAELRLNRPSKLNAFDDAMTEAVVDRLQSAMTDDGVFVVVITGNGRGFCAGADVDGLADRDDMSQTTWALHLRKVQEVVRLLYFGEKPTIAAVNGPAIGAGCDWALAPDLRVMDESAFLREQFVNIGLVPGDGGGWLLPRLVGEARAKEYLLTGRDIDAEEAVDVGLAVEKTPDGECLERARALARDLRDKPRVSMRETGRLLREQASFEEYCGDAIDAQWRATRDAEHDDALEQLRATGDPTLDRGY